MNKLASIFAGFLGFIGLAVAAAGRSPRPFGKGVFVRSTGHAGSPEALVSWCQDLSISWVMLPVVWQYTSKSDVRYDGDIDAYASALRKAGIRVWVWGWPEPAKLNAFADLMLETRARVGADGIVVNAEKPFYGEPAAATALAQRLKGVTWALSSYGAPYFHSSFPWAEFSSTTSLGMPQIYDTKHNLGSDYPEKSVKAWRAAGFSRVAPTWGASSAHTPAQMLDIASRTLDQGGIVAASWWDFYHLKQSAGRRDAVRQIRVPRAQA